MTTFEDISLRMSMPLLPQMKPRVDQLIKDAEQLIEIAFHDCGMSFEEAKNHPITSQKIDIAVREMASAAIIVGPNAGVRSVTSTTGPQTDSVVYARVDAVSFGGAQLTDDLRALLGLCAPGSPQWYFPPQENWDSMPWLK